MNKLVILIVTYNRLDKLKKCLESYTEQTVLPQKILVVDNASTDGTVDFLHRWQCENAEFKKDVVYLHSNSGGSGGFYAGMKNLRGTDFDWLWISDDDAYPESNAIEVLKKSIECNKEYDVFCSSVVTEEGIDTGHRKVICSKKEPFGNAVDIDCYKKEYDDISLSDLEKAGITPDVIKKAVDSSIFLSKKLISHEGTIARNESEVVYFVFDEMRDYYLARRILLKNISVDNVDGEAVLEKLKQLKEIGASCAEGVIHYCYVFFRTDEVVEKLGQTEKMCNAILDLYRIPKGREKKAYWHMHHREEFQNLGLRIILTSGIALADFEIAYIQDCLRKDPYEDGGIIFDTMLDGTLYGGIYNLDIYLDILLGLKNEHAIITAFQTICTRNTFEECFIPKDFISYYDKLADSENKLQIQRIAELFLLCFELHDSDTQEELEDFFYNLPTHDKAKNMG